MSHLTVTGVASRSFDSYKSDVDTFSALDSQIQYGPTFEFEYSTRETYGANIPWSDNDPLNATWWQLVTERESSRVNFRLT